MRPAKLQAGTSMPSMVFTDGADGPGGRPTKRTLSATLIPLAAATFLLFFFAKFSRSVGGTWDRDLLLWLNSFAPGNLYVWELANNSLFRGFPIFFSLVVLWFAGDSRERRSRMLAGFLAVCLATVLSIWMQFHLATHTRPLLDPALPLKAVDPRWSLDWDHRDSLPSDSATLFFALATVIYFEKRLVGLFCILWVAVFIALPRVIFGWHYPTDVVSSLVLGPAFVFLFNAIPYPRRLFERTLILFEGRMYIVHALLFLFLSEAFDVFYSLQKLGKILVRLLG